MGLALSQRGLEHSPDPLNTAGALGYQGAAYLEQGDAAQAIPLLEQSIQHWQQFRFPQLQGWFTALLVEVGRSCDNIAKGQEWARQGWTMTRDVEFAHGVGVAQGVLGRAAQANGARSEAETYFHAALQTFAAISARFEVGRTHL